MTMQAGYQEYNSYTSGFKTIHAGIGYIDPLGRYIELEWRKTF